MSEDFARFVGLTINRSPWACWNRECYHLSKALERLIRSYAALRSGDRGSLLDNLGATISSVNQARVDENLKNYLRGLIALYMEKVALAQPDELRRAIDDLLSRESRSSRDLGRWLADALGRAPAEEAKLQVMEKIIGELEKTLLRCVLECATR